MVARGSGLSCRFSGLFSTKAPCQHLSPTNRRAQGASRGRCRTKAPLFPQLSSRTGTRPTLFLLAQNIPDPTAAAAEGAGSGPHSALHGHSCESLQMGGGSLDCTSEKVGCTLALPPECRWPSLLRYGQKPPSRQRAAQSPCSLPGWKNPQHPLSPLLTGAGHAHTSVGRLCAPSVHPASSALEGDAVLQNVSECHGQVETAGQVPPSCGSAGRALNQHA